jgi:hypothetical protein
MAGWRPNASAVDSTYQSVVEVEPSMRLLIYSKVLPWLLLCMTTNSIAPNHVRYLQAHYSTLLTTHFD